MQIIQRTMLSRYFVAMSLFFAILGCQTTNNTATSEKPAPTVKSGSALAGVENTAASLNQTTPAEKVVKEEAATEKTTDLDKKRLEAAHKRLEGWLTGHVRGREISKTDTKGQTVDATVAPTALEDRLFVALEKKLYGKWINNKETESYEFSDDGTVIIVVIGKRDRRPTLKGHYKLVEEGRIKIDFKGGAYARVIPVRHFKISISENEFTLTDEPTESNGPYGPATTYKRVIQDALSSE